MSKITKQEQIVLNKIHAEFTFENDGTVRYFSIPTQWSSANTLYEAINNCLEANKKQNGLSPLGYVINKYENKTE